MTAQHLSTRLGNAVEGTVNDAIANEGGMVTGYLGIVTWIDGDGNRRWNILTPETQDVIRDAGLAETLSRACGLTIDGMLSQ